ncbi:MAG: M23 family metallopeptidase, partial [Zoogloeaceae bacterium]|nr:M23 family metallopeptidase [Zoogloeaceae bacterium]
MKFAPLVLLAFLLVDVAGAQSGVCLVNPTIHEPPVATSRYGMWRTGRAHEGLDLRSRGGEKLLAAAAGEVVYVGTQTNAGNTVVIKLDNGDYIQYFHMMGYADKLKEGKWKGQRVEAGEVIGTAGKTTASSRVAGGFSTVGP